MLDTITISGGGNPADAPYRSSGSGAYISAGQIEWFRGTSTGDMLKSTPGVIASANRNGASLEVNIRGVQGMNRVKVTVDGSEQTIAEGQGYPGSRTRSYVDPDLIAGIEIEKGPQMSGAGAGAGAIGGSVNMRTLDVQDILKDGKQFGMRLKGGLTSNNRQPPPTGTTTFRDNPTSLFDFDNLNGSVAAAATLGGIDLVAAYSRRRHGNYFAGRHGKSTYADEWGNERTYSLYKPGSEVLNTGLDTESFLLKSSFSFLEDHKVQLSWLRSDFSYSETWPSDLLYGVLKQNDPRETRTNRLTAKYEWDPAENDAIRLRANVYCADTNDKGAAYAFAKPYTSQNYVFDVENVSQFHFDALGSLALTYGVPMRWRISIPARAGSTAATSSLKASGTLPASTPRRTGTLQTGSPSMRACATCPTRRRTTARFPAATASSTICQAVPCRQASGQGWSHGTAFSSSHSTMKAIVRRACGSRFPTTIPASCPIRS